MLPLLARSVRRRGAAEECVGKLVGPEPAEGKEVVGHRAVGVEPHRLADLVADDRHLVLLKLDALARLWVVAELVSGDSKALGGRVKRRRDRLILCPVGSLVLVDLEQLDLEGVADRHLREDGRSAGWTPRIAEETVGEP